MSLNDYIMSQLPASDQMLALDMFAYKAQNPAYKIPIAPVFVGRPFSGKSLWNDCIAAAFKPYSTAVHGTAFHATFNEWLENNIIVTVEEMKPAEFQENYEILKTLISDERQSMEKKFHDKKTIINYSQFLFDTNTFSAAAFDRFDRRMFVVPCPDPGGPASKPNTPPASKACYDWLHDDPAKAGAALMYALLHKDLGGMRPPVVAPLTAEKRRQQMLARSPIQKFAEELMDPRRPPNYLEMAFEQAMGWATAFGQATNAEAKAAADKSGPWAQENLNRIRRRNGPRILMTPTEFLWTFPLCIEYTSGRQFKKKTPAGIVAAELQQTGLPFLANADDSGTFRYFGHDEIIIVLDKFELFANKKFTQEEFDAMIADYSQGMHG